MDIERKITYLLSILLWLPIGTMYATTAGKGVFSVSAEKTIRFATSPETDFVQWETAHAWREDQKNADGHNGWYILNHDEWTYLLVTRDGENPSKNNLGTVNGKKGLIILPDEWVQPALVPAFKPVSAGISCDKNIYTAAEWAIMENAGAIFLPCHGYSEDGSTAINPTDHGAYWSSDQYSAVQGYEIHFDDGNPGVIHDQNTFASKDLYYNVIYVKDVTVTVLDEEDDAAAYATNWTSAKTEDFAYVRRTLRKDSTYYTLCLPFDVPDIEDSPLAGAEVFEFLGGHVSGAPGNEQMNLFLSRLKGNRLTQGVPYLLRWAKTSPVQTLSTPLFFANVENWDTDTETATDPGNETIKLHGVYPKTHIPGYMTGEEAHYNFFLGANNTLYWPDDNFYLTHDMKGFRAYFYIVHDDPEPSPARYRNMPVQWTIQSTFGVPTELITPDAQPSTTPQKILRDGEILLVIDGQLYDLTGRRK